MCSKRRFCSPPPAKRRGGVGGGGWRGRFSASLRAGVCGAIYRLAANRRIRRATPHPRPLPAASRREGGRAGLRGDRAQLHQRRQEPRKRLAGPGGCDQQRGTIVARLFEQRQLMLARRPAAACEPSTKTVREQFGRMVRRSGKDAGRHGSRPKPLRRFRRGAFGHLAPLAGRARIAPGDANGSRECAPDDRLRVVRRNRGERWCGEFLPSSHAHRAWRGLGVLRRSRFEYGHERARSDPPPPTSRASFARLGPHRFAGGGEESVPASREPDPLRLKTPRYSVTGRSEISQSLPLKIEMWSVFIGV
jgi:hypothetical protein